MKKKDLVFIGIIIILLISLIITIIYFKNNSNLIINGEVLAVGSNYLLIGTDDNEDYVVATDNIDYQVGDELKLSINNIKKNKVPYEAVAKDITIINRVSDNESIDDESIDNTTNNGNSVDNNIHSNVDKSNNVNSNNTSNSVNNNGESSVITYFENLDNQLDTYNNNNESLGKTIKSNFVDGIDFIFYGKEINGKTFGELTNSAKLKVLSLMLSIDSKIEEKIPNYKDSISSTYQNIKTKIIEKYLEITTNICNNDEELCITAKEGFADLKTNFGITWDVVKELASNGITKLKDWYEIWRYQ